MVFRLWSNNRYNRINYILSNMAEVKEGWWCIKEECNHYKDPDRCSHKSVKKELGLNELKISRLQMCPVFCSLEACLIHKKIS